MDKPFIVTIDTEGDNLWNPSNDGNRITTKNAKYLYRFQELCEKYGFVPTYLVNYEMAKDEIMKKFGADGLRRRVLEIGAHEHAWNQPPIYSLRRKRINHRGKPYLSEYPKSVIREKLTCLTEILQDTFQCEIKSHRGGRWCMNGYIVGVLSELGYIVDCTCTPGIDWTSTSGYTRWSSGTNWNGFPNTPFFLEKKGGISNNKTRILEVPVSIVDMKKNGYYSWLRPYLNNKREMIALLNDLYEREYPYAEFMIHSSELMPGGSPWFNNEGKIEKVYSNIEEVFKYARNKGFKGMGLAEYSESILCENDKLLSFGLK